MNMNPINKIFTTSATFRKSNGKYESGITLESHPIAAGWPFFILLMTSLLISPVAPQIEHFKRLL